MLDLLRDVPQWLQVLIAVVRLLSIRVDDLCLFFFFNLLPGLLDESLFMVTETRSLFVVYLAYNTNLLLTEREGRTGEYWPEVVTVRTERSEVRTKTTEGHYSPVRPEKARLVSSLLYGTLFVIVKCTSCGLHLKMFIFSIYV